MIALDPSVLPSDVAALLALRGAAVPPLQWHEPPNRTAKYLLLGIKDDAKLLHRETLADEGMAAVVRALLYLWNGWPAECATRVQAAPVVERHYVLGICERQAARPEQAKALFQQVPEHPIYMPLAFFALQDLPATSGPLLRRFQGILELDGRWETCAFVDLCEQARAGKLNPCDEEMVRRWQCREFELLFVHGYEKATGEPFPEHAPREAVKKPTANRQKRTPPSRRPRHEILVPDQKPPGDSPKPSSPEPATVTVACPKCHTKITLPGSTRGNTCQCSTCGAGFLVPGKKAGLAALQPRMPANTVGIQCPKCHEVLTVPEAARGQKEKCRRCGTVFLIPPRTPQPA